MIGKPVCNSVMYGAIHTKTNKCAQARLAIKHREFIALNLNIRVSILLPSTQELLRHIAKLWHGLMPFYSKIRNTPDIQ